MTRETKIAAIQVSMRKMLDDGSFSICSIREAAKLLGVTISSERESFLRLLHCVNFADMPLEIKEELQCVLEDIFSQETFEIRVGTSLMGKPKTKTLTFVG